MTIFDKMNNSDKAVEIKFIDTWPEEEIVNLYKAGGWWKECYDSSGIKNLIKGSYAFAVAVDKKSGKAIGMGIVRSITGRITSKGRSILF